MQNRVLALSLLSVSWLFGPIALAQTPPPAPPLATTPHATTPRTAAQAPAGAAGPGLAENVLIRAGQKAPVPAHFTNPDTARTRHWNANPALKPKDCPVGFANVGGQPASAADLATALGHRACQSR